MTRDEILEEIDKIETKIFYLDMKDRWEIRDYELDDKFRKELLEMRNLLKELEEK